jgi:hypothetical protein
VFWNNGINIEVLPYTYYRVDSVVTEQGQEPWRLNVVYDEAHGTSNERHKTMLDMLSHSFFLNRPLIEPTRPLVQVLPVGPVVRQFIV